MEALALGNGALQNLVLAHELARPVDHCLPGFTREIPVPQLCA